MDPIDPQVASEWLRQEKEKRQRVDNRPQLPLPEAPPAEKKPEPRKTVEIISIY